MKKDANFLTLLLIIAVVAVILVMATGCAPAGYLASGVGAAHTEYKFRKVESRLDAIERERKWRKSWTRVR